MVPAVTDESPTHVQTDPDGKMHERCLQKAKMGSHEQMRRERPELSGFRNIASGERNIKSGDSRAGSEAEVQRQPDRMGRRRQKRRQAQRAPPRSPPPLLPPLLTKLQTESTRDARRLQRWVFSQPQQAVAQAMSDDTRSRAQGNDRSATHSKVCCIIRRNA